MPSIILILGNREFVEMKVYGNNVYCMIRLMLRNFRAETRLDPGLKIVFEFGRKCKPKNVYSDDTL